MRISPVNEACLQLGMGLGAVLALMLVLWLASLWVRNASIVDAFWGPAFAVQAAAYGASPPGGPGAR